MVKTFSETIPDILINQTVSFNDQNTPWINNKVKKIKNKKNEFCNKLKPSIQKETILEKMQCLQKQLYN